MSRLDNLKNNPKQRNIILFGLGLGAVIAATGVYIGTSSAPTPEIAGGAAVVNAPNVKAATGSSNSALYNEKVEQSNKMQAEQALNQDKTFVATPVNKNSFSSSSPIDDLDKQIKAEKEKQIKEQKIQEQQEVVKEEPVAEAAKVEAAPIVEEKPKVQIQYVEVPKYVPQPEKKKRYSSEEDMILLSLLTGANAIKDSNHENNFLSKGGMGSEFSSGNNQMNSADNIIGSSGSSITKSETVLGKAGTIFNAVLETGINSDEPSPILAKVVSGPLKGARLIGKQVTSGEKVIVEFSVASLPKMEKSVAISAVAVDPNSSRTGLASDVDRHYFLKYGVLLGAAFLGGYADALSTQNTTTTQNADGSVITSTGKLTNKEVTQQAIGSVGKELANQTRSQAQTIKPTITVNAGSAIGILLMQDFVASKN